jgi:hypothetical protein
MGEYSVEVRSESFILRGEDSFDERRRHAFFVYQNPSGQGSMEGLLEDIPKIRVALSQAETIARHGVTSRPVLHCCICTRPFQRQESGNGYWKRGVCGTLCFRELEWRDVLEILGEDYRPDPKRDTPCG